MKVVDSNGTTSWWTARKGGHGFRDGAPAVLSPNGTSSWGGLKPRSKVLTPSSRMEDRDLVDLWGRWINRPPEPGDLLVLGIRRD
jgi:hypothetical protein